MGTPSEITSVYGKDFCEKNCATDYKANVWADGSMLPWLTELRRTHGNSWEVSLLLSLLCELTLFGLCHVQGCMNVAGFIEQYQAAKIRDEQWSKIPSVSWVDRDNGSVRGWAGINATGGMKELV